MITNPVGKEIERQQQQGFVENKTGWITPELGFEVKYCPGDEGKVIIRQGGLIYRHCLPQEPQRVEHLVELPDTCYAPMRNLVHMLARELGEGGVAQTAVIKGREVVDVYDPRNKAIFSVDEALRHYRCGWFRYIAPTGESALFTSDSMPSRTGHLQVEIPFRTLDDLRAVVIGDLVGWIAQRRREQK